MKQGGALLRQYHDPGTGPTPVFTFSNPSAYGVVDLRETPHVKLFILGAAIAGRTPRSLDLSRLENTTR
jgi:hypothetical protein